jgi:AcrR family transcriptional regulator
MSRADSTDDERGLVLAKIIKASGEPTAHAAILRVATELFGEKSYPATSMRDIANAVGVLSGSLYAHIESKEALLLEIVDRGISEFYEAVSQAARAHNGAGDRLTAMVHAHVEVVVRHPEQTLVVFHQWRYLSEPAQAIVRRRRKQYEQLFTDVVRAGLEDGTFAPDLDVRIAVLSVLGSLNWTPEWLSSSGPRSIQKISRELTEAMLGGVLRR